MPPPSPHWSPQTSAVLTWSQHDRKRARYHRKVLPKDTHPLFSLLSNKDKQKIRILGGILKIADGLDRTHTSEVKSVKCDLSGKDIIVGYKASCPSNLEMEAAFKKSDLLKQTLGRNIQFRLV